MRLALGILDLASRVNLPIKGGDYVDHYRLLLSTATAINGLHSIDPVYPSIKDIEGLRKESEKAKSLGMTSKLVIHPSQVPVVNNVFTPSREEVEWARKILGSLGEGKGVVVVNDLMVDEAVAKRARRILGMALG